MPRSSKLGLQTVGIMMVVFAAIAGFIHLFML